MIQVAAVEEGVLDALVVEGVEDVGDVAAVDVVFAGVDDDVAGDGELLADEAAAGGASFGVARGASMRARRRWRTSGRRGVL
ncbi:MAG: hypothetical protein OER77_05390 [Myxococcales bacterium]|nr:hypothetical protein [Myxococcales bacterium]